MNKKPELSESVKARANELYLLLKERTYTKEELEDYFYPNKTYCINRKGIMERVLHDRQIRELISILAKRVPVIATSDSKGYRVASTKADMEKVKHQWKEFDGRISELEKRRKPLISFYEKYGGAL